MIKEAKRIAIIGGCGTGKTTLSNNLSEITGLPAYHLDSTNYHANWVARDKDERDGMIREIIGKDKWITDGTYKTTINERLARADFVIYLDYSTFAQVRGVMKRIIKNNGKEKEEIPGCKEQFTWEFFFWTLKWRKDKRPAIIEALQKVDHHKVLIFRKRSELNKWFEKQFGKKIKVNN